MVPEIRFRDEQAQGSTLQARRCPWLRRLILWSFTFFLLLSSFYLFRAPLCRSAANAWIVNDPLDKADAIVILGGGLDTRPIEAARLYHLGLAPKILVMKNKPRPIASLGLTLTETELTRQILLKKDVPESAIIVIGNPDTGVANTHDESLALRDWLSGRQEDTSPGGEGQGEGEISASKHTSVSAFTNSPVVRRPVVSNPLASAPTSDLRPLASSPPSVIIVTDLFHSRRVNWLFRKQLKPLGAHVAVDATPVFEYTAADWWQHENGLVAFQNEVLKYLYYRVKY